MTKAAAVCSVFLGLGFGLPGAYGALYFAREGQVLRNRGHRWG
jgi:hypothetical protein